jgi:hypothetical protein
MAHNSKIKGKGSFLHPYNPEIVGWGSKLASNNHYSNKEIMFTNIDMQQQQRQKESKYLPNRMIINGMDGHTSNVSIVVDLLASHASHSRVLLILHHHYNLASSTTHLFEMACLWKTL